MNRRQFLKAGTIAPVAIGASSIIPGSVKSAFAQSPSSTSWRIFEVTTRVEVLKPAGTTRIWLPVPLVIDTDYQKSLGNQWSAEGGQAAFSQDAKSNMGIVSGEWAVGAKPVLVLTSRFATMNRSMDFTKVSAGLGLAGKEELQYFLQPSELIPTDGIVKTTALAATKGAKTDLDKARAIYDWIVENTFRDPKTRGCGVGDIKFMLENKSYGGKCADLNALYVGLARAAGLPARDVYGVRVANSANGYKSLGRAGDITKAQHCRAEVHLTGYGWVPVDPADVRKVMLEEEAGKLLGLDDERVVRARKALFGGWEMNWLAYNYSHDVMLPKAAKGKVGFFMYPQCETAEGRLDSLDPDNFKYQITSKELSA
ncbi:MAG: transglutaminase domain-containing protein [Betaproteobacteria bacterium]|nr:transglutaminase domain-containing protein [Betaproteobacteria bacterium]